eukprot:GSA25T00015444001.1
MKTKKNKEKKSKSTEKHQHQLVKQKPIIKNIHDESCATPKCSSYEQGGEFPLTANSHNVRPTTAATSSSRPKSALTRPGRHQHGGTNHYASPASGGHYNQAMKAAAAAEQGPHEFQYKNGSLFAPPSAGPTRARPQTASAGRMHGTIMNLGGAPVVSPGGGQQHKTFSGLKESGSRTEFSRTDLTQTLHTIKAQIEKEKARLTAPNWRLPPAQRPQTAGVGRKDPTDHFYERPTSPAASTGRGAGRVRSQAVGATTIRYGGTTTTTPNANVQQGGSSSSSGGNRYPFLTSKGSSGSQKQLGHSSSGGQIGMGGGGSSSSSSGAGARRARPSSGGYVRGTSGKIASQLAGSNNNYILGGKIPPRKNSSSSSAGGGAPGTPGAGSNYSNPSKTQRPGGHNFLGGGTAGASRPSSGKARTTGNTFHFPLGVGGKLPTRPKTAGLERTGGGIRSGMTTSLKEAVDRSGKKIESSVADGGHYVTGRTIGQGAYAVVRSCTHYPSGRGYAVKIFDKTRSSWDNRKKLVYREVKLMEKICCYNEHICNFVEFVDGEHFLHLFMEEVNGGNLRQELNKKQLRRITENTVRDYFWQICDGIEYLHQNLVVHRDIKLENLLLHYGPSSEGASGNSTSGQGQIKTIVKIVDFGFAVKLQSPCQKLKVFCGTPSYMSPEIVAGKEYSGFQSDVWALGVVLYVLLFGRFPFKANQEHELYHKIRRGSFSLADSHVSSTAKRVIKGILRVDGNLRPVVSQVANHNWVLQGRPAESVVSVHSNFNTLMAGGSRGTRSIISNSGSEFQLSTGGPGSTYSGGADSTTETPRAYALQTERKLLGGSLSAGSLG